MITDRLASPTSHHALESKLTFRKHASAANAGPDTLNVTLFRDGGGTTCGWFIGPLVVHGGEATLPYLPQSKATHAAVAVVRAIEAGQSAGCPVCVIDPDDLWDGVWRV